MAKAALPDETLRNLYRQLAALEKAGVPPQAAFGQFAQAPKELGRRAAKAILNIRKGMGVARAARLAGLFSEFDAELLQAAEDGGKLQEGYKLLADYYEQRTRLWQQIKAKSALPVLVFALALFVQPLPDLVAHRIDGFGYLRQTLGVLLAMGFAARLAWRWRGLAQSRPIEYVQLYLPFWRDWQVRRQMKDYYHALALLLASGVDMLAALPKARNTVRNSLLREDLESVEYGVRQGLRFYEALARSSAARPAAVQLIQSGEVSGSLEGILAHYVQLEAGAIELENTLLAEWLPRLFYWLVLAYMARNLLL